MNFNNTKLMLLTAIFSSIPFITQAQYVSAEDIYEYAKDRNYKELARLSRYMDTQDSRGNTALCLAVIDDDQQAYTILKRYGANPRPYCLQSAIAASKSGTFLGMGTTGWLTVGAIAAAGTGVAIAAGGGGGGGGGGSSSSGSGSSGAGSQTQYLDKEPITDVDEGHEIIGKDISVSDFDKAEDYLKAANNESIKKIVKSQSAVSGIVSDSQFTFNAVSIGGNKKADIVIAQRGSGNVYGIKGPKTNELPEEDEDGINVHNAVIVDPEEGVASGKVTGNITIRNTGTGTENIYGMQSEAEDVYVNNAQADSESSSATATGNILIENVNSNKNVYGIYSKSDAVNSEAYGHGTSTGNITINNSGNGNVFGIQSYEYNVVNAGATENGKAIAHIDINNSGSGNVYGINGPQGNKDTYYDWFVFNAAAANNATATGYITIHNTGSGTGNIYGLRSNGNIYVGNALGIQELWEDDYEIDTSVPKATGSIVIENTNSNKNVYGIYAKADAVNAESDDNAKVTASITIKNSGNGNVYGIQTSKDNTRNASATENSEAVALIDITNKGNGNVYGINEDENYHNKDLYNAQAGERKSHEGDYKEEYPAKATATINIENTGAGNVYGIKSLTEIYNAHSYYNSTAIGKIRVSNNGNGNAYGMHGNSVIKNASAHSEDASNHATAKGYVTLLNRAFGNVYGIYSNVASNYIMNNSETDGETQQSVIELANIGNGLAVGMYSKDGTAENSGEIKIHNLADGVAVGIYADGSTSATNSGTITIDRASYKDDKANNKDSDDVTYTAKSEQGGQAIGIYGASGSHITNTASGVIRINGAERAYGIYTEGGDVTNDGKIYIDGTLKTNQCTGSNCLNQNYAIVLNGGKLFQNGVLASANSIQTGTMSANTASLNLNDFGGTVVASDTSQFVVEGAISGNLAINNSVVENGFDTTYSVKDMIQAQDTGGLNLQSQSALFDATLQNNTDAVMTMKAFNDVVENSSVADFLQNNYAANNNEDLFKTLKSASSVAQLNSNIDDLFGKSMLSRMAFEDLSMLREVNFDMNNHLFEKEGTFAFGENISPSGYDNNTGSVGRYSLNGYNNGRTSFGLGVSITDVRTNDGNRDNRRFDRNFMMSAPIGHRTRGFELITTPKMGYADGVYDRKGLNNITYDGKIQKRMFALMNEARYPLDFGGVKLVPSAEFNMIGYNIKGHEDKEQYALRIKSQNHYSVEAGFGLMAEKEFKPFKNHKFNINGGVAVYHEFANPYQLKVGMNDMDGYYKLQDEKRSDNRTVVRFGLGYELKDNIDVSTSWLTNIDREYRTDANLDLKYRF